MTKDGDGSLGALDPVSRSAPYAALAVEPSGLISRLNDAARALLGASAGSALADRAPGWLADAHRSLADHPAPVRDGRAGTEKAAAIRTARGPIGDRIFEARAVAGHSAQGGPAPTIWWLTDITEEARLAQELAAERRRMAFLAEESSWFLGSLNLERCMEAAVRLAARHLADTALVIAAPSGHTHSIASCGPDGNVDHQELVIDPAEVPGLVEAMQGFPAPRWIDPSGVPAWVARPEPGEHGAIAVIALPGQGVPAGALLLHRRGRQGFSEGEETVVRLFARHAGAAMAAARLHGEQASITETLMRDLLPPPAQHLPGIELAARYRPSEDAERVGGDFYDVYPAESGGESLVVLGDVAGKGLEAAVLTGKIRTTLRALLPLAGDHRRVLELVNAALLHDGGTRFATLVLASVRREGRRVRVRLTSAGHAPPLIVRADGPVEEVPTGGSLIGVLDEIASTTAEVTLRSGDTCLLYTDGITEAFGGPLGDEMFGDERLCAGLAGCGGMLPEALVERIHMLAAEWVGGNRHDDMAIIAITAPRHARQGTS
ncbi:PP2C family protein-serine/threonine phosphatase [Actinomadura sp. 9N407]|uniref:PP2C family protein-serine/threonine phosphatase n=1 Tax=Actinomadura sp. 9N407 TaxID=3375154 RepID=UPI00379B9FB5